MKNSSPEKQGDIWKGPKALRVQNDVWEEWGKAADQIGLTRSAFIKRATAAAADLVLAGRLPYFVNGAEGTTQNTRISFFETEGNKTTDASETAPQALRSKVKPTTNAKKSKRSA